MANVELRPFRAEDSTWLINAHAELYARDEGFDDSFGALVASIVEDFNNNHDPTCEQGWIALRDGVRGGSIFCVRQDAQTAKLRLFLLLPELRGQGSGRKMLDTCMSYARARGYRRMELYTHESHRAACALYAAAGWQLADSRPVRSFGCDLVEQSWKITL